MTEQLLEIGKRLGALREIMDISAEKMAEALKLDVSEYLAYEKGQKDFSFSFLQNAASILGVDIIDIISGESPKLSKCAFVRKGEGFYISRQEAYVYKHLAYTFRDKKAEPFLVTVEPSKDEKPTLHTHEGQEFDYMVSGTLEFHYDDIVYIMKKGDSVYYDSGTPHTMKAVGKKPAKFIAVVIK